MNSSPQIELRWISERHLRVAGPMLVDAASIHAAAERLRSAAIAGLIDLSPAHSTLLLEFDRSTLETGDAERAIRAALEVLSIDELRIARRLYILVCFEGDFAPDLAEAAQHSNQSVTAFVEAFVGSSYSVRFLGFSPGFAYLDGLPPQLTLPRRAAPRPRVAAGSVGIAGNQTGIYPHASPGGWQLIGRTPLRIFDATREPPALLACGDEVRFVPISRGDFERLAREQA